MGIRTYIRSLAPLSWRNEFIYFSIVSTVLWSILAYGLETPWVAVAAIAVFEFAHLHVERVPPLPDSVRNDPRLRRERD